MVGISAPPEKIIHPMTKQIYKTARKHKDHRVLLDDWYNWWATDASCRNALKMFCWNRFDMGACVLSGTGGKGGSWLWLYGVHSPIYGVVVRIARAPADLATGVQSRIFIVNLKGSAPIH